MSRVLCFLLLALLLGAAAPAAAQDEELPDGAVRATVVSVVDGDTIKVELGGKGLTRTVRLLGIDAPETVDPDTPEECYGAEASKRLAVMLPRNRTVWLERDVTDEDQYDRLLRWVWFKGKDDGKAYLANEILVREGYAVVATFPPDVAHVERLTAAQDAAVAAQAGLWAACGGADTPLSAVAPAGGGASGGGASGGGTGAPGAAVPEPVVTGCEAFGSYQEANAYYAARPDAQPYLDPDWDGLACEVYFGVEAPAPAPAPVPDGGCDPSYPTLCIPVGAPDLDCPEVGVKDFPVYQPDPHGFDRDHDGIGCES